MSKKLDRFEGLYATLEDLMSDRKQDVTVLELGILDEKRSGKACDYWQKQTGGKYTYVGFDVFPDEENKDLAVRAISRPGASVTVINGEIAFTVPTFVEAMRGSIVPDVIIITGVLPELAEESWKGVYDLLTPSTIVLFDNYSDTHPEFGSTPLVTKLRQNPLYAVELMSPVDDWNKDTKVRLAAVKKKVQGAKRAA